MNTVTSLTAGGAIVSGGISSAFTHSTLTTIVAVLAALTICLVHEARVTIDRRRDHKMLRDMLGNDVSAEQFAHVTDYLKTRGNSPP